MTHAPEPDGVGSGAVAALSQETREGCRQPAAHDRVYVCSNAARREAVRSPARCLIKPSLAAARSLTCESDAPPFVTVAVTTTGFIPPTPPAATTRIIRCSAQGSDPRRTLRPARPSTRATRSTVSSNGKATTRSISCTFFLMSLATKRVKPPQPPATAARAASSSARSSSSRSSIRPRSRRSPRRSPAPPGRRPSNTRGERFSHSRKSERTSFPACARLRWI